MAFRHWVAGDCAGAIARYLEGFTPPAAASGLSTAVAPHAGWRYSGAVAARAIKTLTAALSSTPPEAILCLGAVHRAWIERAAVYPDGAWATPLGPVEVDAALARDIVETMPDLADADRAPHADEHALEVLMPFVRHLFPGVPVVPVMVPPEGRPAQLGHRLAELAGARRIAAIASTDLTHYGEAYGFAPAGTGEKAHEWMRENDARILDLATLLRAEEVVPEARARRNACGPGALAAAVAFARARGAASGRLLERTDSHEVTGEPGEFEMAVGYAGLVM
jgi:hypothetical protein